MDTPTPAPQPDRLAAARTAKAEMRTEELIRSTDPKDNAAKVKAIQDGTLHSADLYRTIMSGPSGQKSHVFVGRVRYTPDRHQGEFEVIDTNSGERAGWMTRTVRNGEQVYVLHAEDYDGGIRLVGWTDTVSYGADVLVNGSSRASTRGTLDARRLSGGSFEAYVPKSPEQLDREMEQRDQAAAFKTLDTYRAAADEALRAAIGKDTEAIKREDPLFFGYPDSDIDSFMRIFFNSKTPIAEFVESIKTGLDAPKIDPAELDTPRVKPDDVPMTTTAAEGRQARINANVQSGALDKSLGIDAETVARRSGTPRAAGEPTIGVTTSSKGRTTTVTLPDGTTEQRTSKTKEYTHAVVVTTDNHSAAASMREHADRMEQALAKARQIIASGDLTQFKRVPGSGSVAFGTDYESRVPGFEDVSLQLADYTDAYAKRAQASFERKTREGATFPGIDYTDFFFANSAARNLDRAEEQIAKSRADADKLDAGPRYSYGVWRWSQSRANAEKGRGEFEGQHRTTRVIGVGDDITGQTADETKAVKAKPTAEQRKAAQAERAAAEKARVAKSNEEWTARKVADIRRALAEGNTERARGEVTSITDKGLRAIARAMDIRSTPRGLSERERIDWLRKTILQAAMHGAAKGSGPKA